MEAEVDIRSRAEATDLELQELLEVNTEAIQWVAAVAVAAAQVPAAAPIRALSVAKTVTGPALVQ